MSHLGKIVTFCKQFAKMNSSKLAAPIARGLTAAPKKAAPSVKGAATCKDAGGPKPVMRNLHMQQSLKNIYVGSGLVFIWIVGCYFFRNRRHQNQYRKFYENYDADAAFERMLNGGIFSSCEPETDDKKKKKK